jgi:hypothetical protein
MLVNCPFFNQNTSPSFKHSSHDGGCSANPTWLLCFYNGEVFLVKTTESLAKSVECCTEFVALCHTWSPVWHHGRASGWGVGPQSALQDRPLAAAAIMA